MTKRLICLACVLCAALGGCALLPSAAGDKRVRQQVVDDVPAMMRLLKPDAGVHALRTSVTCAELNA